MAKRIAQANIEPKYHTFVDLNGMQATAGVVVPQMVYRDNRTWMGWPDDHPRQAPIDFAHDGVLGVNVADLVSGAVTPDESVVCRDFSPTAFSVRLHWPGYNFQRYSLRPHAGVAPAVPNQVDVKRLAKLVALKVQAYFETIKRDKAGWRMSGDTVAVRYWEIDDIELSHVNLLRLYHVTEGTWQPMLSFNHH